MTYPQAIVIASAIVAGAILLNGRTGADTPAPAVTLEQLRLTLVDQQSYLSEQDERLRNLTLRVRVLERRIEELSNLHVMPAE